MKGFLIPWYNEAKIMGISSIGTEIGDYNIPYQFYVALITYLPINPIISYKLLSIMFDYILAISSSYLTILLTRNKENKNVFLMVYTITLFLPTIFLNSGYWGQADSIYTALIIISLTLLVKEKYIFSFVFLGIALSIKLQTIFILPLFLFYYFLNKSYSIVKMALVFITSFYVMCLPGFVYGRSLLDPIKVYISQSNYSFLWANYPNFWSIITPYTSYYLYSLFKVPSLIICFVIFFATLYIMLYRCIKFNKDMILYLSIFSVYTCVMFLVNMHDRYAYMLDVLFIIGIFINKRLAVFSIIPILINILIYGNYLFLKGVYLPYNFIGIVNIINYILCSVYILKIIFNSQSTRNKNSFF